MTTKHSGSFAVSLLEVISGVATGIAAKGLLA
jgi:hypothetical protein